jgi:hypothetical protein
MKSINIAPFLKEISIFDDPEFCSSVQGADMPGEFDEKCPKLGDYDKEGWCYLFDEWVDSEKPLTKCNECKEAYQMVLLKRQSERA